MLKCGLGVVAASTYIEEALLDLGLCQQHLACECILCLASTHPQLAAFIAFTGCYLQWL